VTQLDGGLICLSKFSNAVAYPEFVRARNDSWHRIFLVLPFEKVGFCCLDFQPLEVRASKLCQRVFWL